jgi:DNA-directed RNA polymerase subunit RPC12/RpoP
MLHSANGRAKRDVASENKEGTKRMVVTCDDCGNQMPERSKEFGEDTACTNCGSKNLVNKWE